MGRFRPVPDFNHWSLKADGERKGSYYRRIEDIHRALRDLSIEHLPTTIKFLGLYFGCEKLAYGIVGIHFGYPAADAYSHRHYLCLTELEKAALALKLPVLTDSLCFLFADRKDLPRLHALNAPWPESARIMRNKVGHDLGPTNIEHVRDRALFFIPKMAAFLGCSTRVLSHLSAHYPLSEK
jgi:hypothetical protein